MEVSGEPARPRRSGMFFCLVGPAGGGKTTFGELLLERFGPALRREVTVTTRSPRPGEIEGVSYHFISREEFARRREAGEFFESEEVHGNLYGTLRRSLDEAIQGGADLFLPIDVRGARSFKRAYPTNTVIVFLAPPSWSVLVERLTGRGVGDEELERRLETAKSEYRMVFEESSQVDYLVVNDEVGATFELLASIVVAERARYRRLCRDELERFCRPWASAGVREEER